MPTKTDRILGYLPGTFRPDPARSALQAVAEAFGGELQRGENLLAQVMQAHWVDFADRGAPTAADLTRIAALYGLAPRPDETTEQFRTHLKRFVRTLLDGTVTVAGLLRVAAEALGVEIADADDEIDSWWRRGAAELVTVEADGADAATLLLGAPAVDVRGTPARRAEILGTPDLTGGADLREVRFLYLVVDAAAPVAVDLAEGAADAAAVPLAHMVDRIDAAVGPGVATAAGDRLVVRARSAGPDARIEVREGPDDAATAVLGLLPLSYRGRDETAAQIVGHLDHAAGIDLSERRYLRLLVDGQHLAEVDCAGTDPAATFLDHVRDAINTAIGIPVADHDGHHLAVRSPTTGAASSVALQRAGAQDAAAVLFGPGVASATGTDPVPARVRGTVELPDGVDLSERSLLRLRVDDLPTVTLDCAGAVPKHTALDEVVAAINAAVGVPVADRTGTRLRISSPSTGELAEVALDPVPNDAAPALLGLPPRLAEGAAATAGHVTGSVDLSAGAAVSAHHLLDIALDGGPFARVDLRAEVGQDSRLGLDDLVAAINAAVGTDAATHDGARLVLRSRRPGGGSRVMVAPVTTSRRRRFVTRAFLVGEAAKALFGVDAATARGDGASRASVTGAADLSHGVDLSAARHLRIVLDDGPALDIDCAGNRPRATLLDDVVKKINEGLPAAAAAAPPVASHDGRHLTITSRSSGAGSAIAFETPQAADARAALLGDAPGFARGSDATGVAFLGVADLAGGIDLPPHAALAVGVDGAAPVQVALTGEEGAHRSLGELAAALNLALGPGIAHHDGTRLALVSPTRGAASRLTIEVPQGGDTQGSDVTAAVLGIAAPREYHGADAQRARIVGLVDVGGELALRVARRLVIALDGGPEVAVDCAAGLADPDHATIEDVVAAIRSALQAPVATVVGRRLVLESATAGASGRITVAPFAGGDARALLFGPAVPTLTRGQPARPAVLTGTVDLLGPADLSGRSRLLVAVDDGPPREIDVAGPAPGQTTLADVVSAVDAVLPGVATGTADARLRLISPTVGPGSRLDLLPLRSLEVVEYPPVLRASPAREVRHGERLRLDNDGAADASLAVALAAPQGNAGFALVNRTRGTIVELRRPLGAGETARLWRTPDGGLAAEAGVPAAPEPVPAEQLRGGALGAWTRVPHAAPRVVSRRGLALDNPAGTRVDTLFARHEGVTAEVTPAALNGAVLGDDLDDGDGVTLTGRLQRADGGWALVDGAGAAIVALRRGPTVAFADHEGAVVGVSGVLHLDEPPFVLVERLSRRFDVTLRAAGAQSEAYRDVTIGQQAGEPVSLLWRLANDPTPSRLVRGRGELKGYALTVERGRREWQVLECTGSRFDHASFGAARFAGGPCARPAIFGVSDFSAEGDPGGSVFAGGPSGPPSLLTMSWTHHRPGAVEVNLPADLPDRFGARFGAARFASDPERPERYDGAVTEPPEDDDNLVARINARSVLLRAEPAATVPIGFTAATLPFRRPRRLNGGGGARHARLYLAEPGAPGFVLLEAREQGEHGNRISVSARPGGPARFDVTVATDGARFEAARAAVAGPPSTIADRATLTPAPFGVLAAKAAGIGARVTRDRTR